MPSAKKILLIDDDEDDRALFVDAVKEVDSTVAIICCTGGKEALQLLQQENLELPDCIFLDINMPYISGKRCLTEIKKIEKLTTTPVFMYSTSNNPSEKKEFEQLGAAIFFTKPTRYNDLLTIVSFAISG